MAASESVLKTLADPKTTFVRRLQIAAAVELDYWEDRNNPPNLSITDLKRILPLIPINLQPIWEARQSSSGPHAEKGEKNIFKMDFGVTVLRKNLSFFIKGYFFDEDQCRGVVIQSFRKTVNKLRMIK